MPISQSATNIYTADGVSVTGADGAATPASALLVAGQDGTNLQSLKTDTTGRPEVVGPGVAGTPAGGVLSVQGVAGGTAVPISGTVTTTAPTSATGTISSVASSASSVTLLASNASRKGASIYNDSNKKLYVKSGAAASTSSFSFVLEAGAYGEVPFGYTGIIDGIWASANGNARVTEYT